MALLRQMTTKAFRDFMVDRATRIDERMFREMTEVLDYINDNYQIKMVYEQTAVISSYYTYVIVEVERAPWWKKIFSRRSK